MSIQQSVDYNQINASKNEFAYGDNQKQERSTFSNSLNKKASGMNIQLNINDSSSKIVQNKSKPRIVNISHSLQNSARK